MYGILLLLIKDLAENKEIKGEIEKNFLLKKDVGYEKEYFKYIVGIGYSYYF